LETLKRFRIVAVQLSLLLTAVGGGAAYAFFGYAAAQGVLMGGIAGVLGFWILAVRIEKFAALGAGKVKWVTYRWTAARLILYALVLVKGYSLDRERLSGLIGAVGGIFIIQIVLIFLGVTGFDLKRKE